MFAVAVAVAAAAAAIVVAVTECISQFIIRIDMIVQRSGACAAA